MSNIAAVSDRPIVSAAESRPVEVATTAPAAAAPTDQVQSPYFSPVIRIDAKTSDVVLVYRDSATGAVKNSIPTTGQIRAYQAQIASTESNDASRAV